MGRLFLLKPYIMKLTKEQAKAEFDKWAEFKHLRENKRKAFEAQEEIITEALQYGDIVLKDDFTLEYKLIYPIQTDTGEEVVSVLKFKPRIRKQDMISHYRGIKVDDADKRVLATIAALVDKSESTIPITKNLIGKLYTEDMEICEAIAVYFL